MLLLVAWMRGQHGHYGQPKGMMNLPSRPLVSFFVTFAEINAAAIPSLIKNFTIYILVPSEAAWESEDEEPVTFVRDVYSDDSALILFAAGKKTVDGELPTSLVTSGSKYVLPLAVNADGTVTVEGPEGTAIATPVPIKCGNGELVVWSLDTVLVAPPMETPSPAPSPSVVPSSSMGVGLAACFWATAAVVRAMPLV